jgi:hypothetical protein
MLFFKYLPGHYQGADHTGRRVLNFDSGGSSQPTQTSTISIPEYAQPYMERILGRTEALTEAPYQIYGGERFAGPTDAQAQARGEAGMLQAPGQFDVGTGLVGAAGLAGLSSQYGPSQFAAERVALSPLEQFQARGPANVQSGLSSFAQPGAAEFYMSPYQQAVTDVQKQSAIREAQLAQQQANLGSARQGTYGGARQALAQAERERGLLDRMSNIQATGSQAAFEQAQKAFEAEQARGLQAGLQTQQLGTQSELENLRARLGVQQLGTESGLQAQRANQQALLDAQRLAEQSRQFGSEFGLKGQELGLRAGEGLAKLGATEQAADLERLKFQEAMGQLSQADQQRLYDLQYQDFVAQQQAPYQQIGFMSDILRGSGSLAKNVGVYDAPASPLQQIVGPGLLGLGVYKEFMR